MQAIWSRVAQAQACYCRACSRATPTLAKRPTAPIRSPPPLPQPRRRNGTLSNVPKSRHMATEAAVPEDTDGMEEDIPEEIGADLDKDLAWDALAKLVKQPDARRHHGLLRSRAPSSIHKASRVVYEAVSSICDRPGSLERQKGRVDTRIDYINSIRRSVLMEESPQPRWWRTPSKRRDEVEELVSVEETSGHVVNREPTTPVQVEKYNSMLNNLVDQLLAEVYKDEHGNPTTPDLLNSAWNEVRMLRSGGYPKYRLIGDNPKAVATSRTALNRIIGILMRDWGIWLSQLAELRRTGRINASDAKEYEKKQEEYFVGKICHNLLVVEYLPGIQNYNTLISGFLKLGQYHLARPVIHSFLFKSHLRPTQMTIALMLHYSRLAQDLSGFYALLGRLTGQDARGIGLGRRAVEDVQTDRTVRKWAQDSDVALADGFIINVAAIDTVVAEAVLDGLIDFDQPRQAATVLMACLREGHPIDSRYLHRVIGLSSYHLDRVAGMIILQDFLENIAGFTLAIAAITPSHFHELIQLVDIGISNLERVLVVPPEQSRWVQLRDDYDWKFRLGCLSRAVETPLILARLGDVQRWARTFGFFLSCNPELSLRNIDHHYMGISSVLDKYKEIEAGAFKHRLIARLDWIAELCRINDEKLRTHEHNLICILIRHIPKRYRCRAPFDTSIALEERLQVLNNMKESLPWRRQVHSCFNKAHRLEMRMKRTLCTYLPGEPDTKRQARLTLEDAVGACSAHLARLEQEWSDPSSTRDSGAPSSKATATSTTGKGKGKGKTVEMLETDMFTSAMLARRFVPIH